MKTKKKSPLERAFYKLRANRIYACHHFACCGSCGHGDLSRDPKPGCNGYAFYHVQSSEFAAESGELWIGYDSYFEGERSAKRVGQHIVKAFREVGLQTEWDGTCQTNVKVVLADEDKAFLRGLLDADQEECANWTAKECRMRTLWRAWRIVAFRQKVAKRKISGAVLEWGLRPGGFIFKSAQSRFESS